MSTQSAQARRPRPRWSSRRSWSHALLLGLILSSCTLVVPLDDLSGGPDPADASADSRDAQPDVPTTPASPVVVTRSAELGTVSARVEGKFQIDFLESSGWQPARWFDLQLPVIEDLVAPAKNLTTPCEIFIADGADWFGAEFATDRSIAVLEETPGRAVVRATYEHDENWGFIRVQTDYTIYASGRIAAHAVVMNIASSGVTLDDVEIAHVNVSADLSWAATALSTDRAFAFVRADGMPPASNFLVVNTSQGSEMLQADNDTNRYWRHGSLSLPKRESFDFTWEIQLVPGGQDALQLADRASDVLDPGIAVVSGVTLVGTGYDPTQGAYRLTAPGPTSVFQLTAAEPRHQPAFVITGWTSPTWQVKRGDRVITSSDAPIGPTALGDLDAAAETLVFVDLEELPTSATAAERTFTITP